MKTIEDIRRAADQVAEGAEERLNQLLAERDMLDAEINEVRALARRYRSSAQPTQQQRPGKNSKASAHTAGPKSQAIVADAILQNYSNGTPWNVTDITNLVPLSDSGVRNAVNALRGRQAIRLAERRPTAESNQPIQFYRTLDTDVLAKIARA